MNAAAVAALIAAVLRLYYTPVRLYDCTIVFSLITDSTFLFGTSVLM